MEAGYVYILSNPSFPNLVYIGKHTRPALVEILDKATAPHLEDAALREPNV